MTEPMVFIRAEQALSAVIDQIKPSQWEMKLPEWFQIGSSQNRAELTLRKIVNYQAYDTAWVPDVLAGKTIAEVGTKYDGDLIGQDPAQAYRALSISAQAAANSIRPEDLDKPVHISYGDFPASEYLKHITTFRAFRAYDISKLIGANTQLPEDLVQGLWDQIVPEVEEWRKMGVFGPEVKVPADADLQTKLLGLVGRDPAAG